VAADRNVLVEVSVDSVASAIAAQNGGATRVELCSALMEGGLTPSAGVIETTRAAISIPLFVMIRPRGGDFLYDDYEFTAMRRDIEVARHLRAHGVVFGILLANGDVDVHRTRELVDLARPLPVTFHRAFDMTRDMFRALEDVCATGAERLLTSGGAATVSNGAARIEELIKKAGPRVLVMPGSGIKPHNARTLVDQTRAREIHVGLRSVSPSPMLYRNAGVTMGSIGEREYERFSVREEDVRALCAALY